MSGVPYRVRLRFAKRGDLRFISHRDLARLMERLFNRAGVSVQLSEGFHPKPRMMFPSALALGVVGKNEILEVDLAQPLSEAELVAKLNAATQPGIEFHSAEVLPPGSKKAQPRWQVYHVRVPGDLLSQVRENLTALLADDTRAIQREGHPPMRVADFVQQLGLEEDRLSLTLRMTSDAGLRPRDILTELGIPEAVTHQSGLTRVTVEVEEPTSFAQPGSAVANTSHAAPHSPESTS
jgi:radical SAM-linked protein